MELRKKILVLSLLALTVFIGCSWRQVILHPIEKSDIFRMEEGVEYVSEKDGYFVSDYYVEEVMKVKVGE